jgi:hypothetical protein
MQSFYFSGQHHDGAAHEPNDVEHTDCNDGSERHWVDLGVLGRPGARDRTKKILCAGVKRPNMALLFDTLCAKRISTRCNSREDSGATVTITPADTLVIVTQAGAKAVNLPSIASCYGKEFSIINGTAGAATIAPDGTDVLGSSALTSLVLSNEGDQVNLQAGSADSSEAGVARWIY